MTDTFIPGTLRVRGKYIRHLEAQLDGNDILDYADEYATLADKERELRLVLLTPKAWMSQFFCKDRSHEDLHELFEALIGYMSKAGYDMAELDEWNEETFKID